MRFSFEQLRVGTQRRREAAGDVVRSASKRPCREVQNEPTRAPTVPSEAAPTEELRRESPPTEAPIGGDSSVGVEVEPARDSQSAPAETTRDEPTTTIGTRKEAGGKEPSIVEVEGEATLVAQPAPDREPAPTTVMEAQPKAPPLSLSMANSGWLMERLLERVRLSHFQEDLCR